MCKGGGEDGVCEGGCGRMVCVKVGGWWVEWCKCMCSAPVNK